MRALWSTVFAWSCLLQSFACSSTAEAPGSGVDPNAGGALGVGGIVAVGGTQSSGGIGNGGLGNGGIPAGGANGSGGILVGNGGIPNGSGGFLASGGFVNTGGFLDTGGFGNGGNPPATGGAPPGTGGATVGQYPAGPYGVAVGNTFPNIQLQGYVNDSAVGIANTQPFTALYTMDTLRVSGKRYALIHNSEFL